MYIPADPSPAYKPWTWLDVAKHSLNFLGLSWQLFVLVWVTIFEQQRRLFIPFVLLVVGYNSYWIVRFLVQLVYVIVACVVVYAWYNWFFRLAPRSSGRYQALTALRRLVAAQPTTNNSLTFVHSRTPSPERSISPDSRSFREPEETVWWASNNVLRPPPFSQPQAWKEWQKRREKEAVMTGYGEPPGLRIESAKLNQLVEMLINYVVRDFVDSWYRNYVSRELAVSLQIHALLRHITNHLVEDVTKKDFVSFIVNRVLPLFKQHIHECRKAERTLKSIKAYRAVYLDPNMRLEKDDTVESYVARCYRDGYVHDAITEKPVPTLSFELKYLRKLIGVMMKHFCPEREMNSSLVRIFVREVLVSRIVQPSLDYLSDPDYWNQMINRMADFLSAGESNLVNKIQQALEDQQWNGVRYDDGDQGEAGGGDWITADLMESKKIADRFVRYTRQVNNLEESYALHAKVTDDIHEIRSIIGGMAADEYVQGRKVQDFKVHLKRLHTARKRLDARIIDLGGYLEKPTKDSRAMDDLNGPPLRNVLESEDDSLFHVFMAWIRNRDRDRFLLFWIRVNQVLITAAPVIDEKMRTISPTGQDGGDSKSPSPTKTSFQQRGPPRTIRTNSQPGISEITSPISVVDAKTVEREQIEKWRSLADLIIDLHRTFLARGAMYRIDVASPAIGREVDKLITSIDSYVTESNRNVALLDLMGKPFAPNSKDQDFQSFQQDVQLVVRHLMDIQDQVFAVLKSEDYPMFLQSTDYLKYTAQVSPGAQMLSPTKIKTGERIMRAISPIPTDGTGRDEKGTPAVLKGKHSWSGSSPSLLQTATPNLSQRPPLPGDGRLVGNEIEEENQPDSIARSKSTPGTALSADDLIAISSKKSSKKGERGTPTTAAKTANFLKRTSRNVFFPIYRTPSAEGDKSEFSGVPGELNPDKATTTLSFDSLNAEAGLGASKSMRNVKTRAYRSSEELRASSAPSLLDQEPQTAKQNRGILANSGLEKLDLKQTDLTNSGLQPLSPKRRTIGDSREARKTVTAATDPSIFGHGSERNSTVQALVSQESSAEVPVGGELFLESEPPKVRRSETRWSTGSGKKKSDEEESTWTSFLGKSTKSRRKNTKRISYEGRRESSVAADGVSDSDDETKEANTISVSPTKLKFIPDMFKKAKGRGRELEGNSDAEADPENDAPRGVRMPFRFSKRTSGDELENDGNAEAGENSKIHLNFLKKRNRSPVKRSDSIKEAHQDTAAAAEQLSSEDEDEGMNSNSRSTIPDEQGRNDGDENNTGIRSFKKRTPILKANTVSQIGKSASEGIRAGSKLVKDKLLLRKSVESSVPAENTLRLSMDRPPSPVKESLSPTDRSPKQSFDNDERSSTPTPFRRRRSITSRFNSSESGSLRGNPLLNANLGVFTFNKRAALRRNLRKMSQEGSGVRSSSLQARSRSRSRAPSVLVGEKEQLNARIGSVEDRGNVQDDEYGLEGNLNRLVDSDEDTSMSSESEDGLLNLDSESESNDENTADELIFTPADEVKVSSVPRTTVEQQEAIPSGFRGNNSAVNPDAGVPLTIRVELGVSEKQLDRIPSYANPIPSYANPDPVVSRSSTPAPEIGIPVKFEPHSNISGLPEIPFPLWTQSVSDVTKELESRRAQERKHINLLRVAETSNGGPQAGEATDQASSMSIQDRKDLIVGVQASIARLEAQKVSIISEVLDNVLAPEKTTVSIPTIQVLEEESGKEFIVYEVEVVRTANENAYYGLERGSLTWTVRRRFGDFTALHQQLRTRFPSVNQIELPNKAITDFWKLKKEFVENRRTTFERYLQSLLRMRDVGKAVEFRNFICNDELRHLFAIYRPTQLGVTIQQGGSVSRKIVRGLLQMDVNMFRTPSGQPVVADAPPEPGISAPPLQPSSTSTLSAIPNQLFNAYVPPIPQPVPTSAASATDVLSDLLMEMFELREKNNWLRRNTMVFVLQQVFGGAVERRINDTLKWFVGEENMTYLITTVKDTFWPGGVWYTSKKKSEPIPPVKVESPPMPAKDTFQTPMSVRTATASAAFNADRRRSNSSPERPLFRGGSTSPTKDKTISDRNAQPGKDAPSNSGPRTLEQRKKTREEAQMKLASLLPEILGQLVGRQNARRGANQIVQLFQNRRLNQQLIYSLFDEVACFLYPELEELVSSQRTGRGTR